MRAMLVANIDVPHGFANGTTGRIVHWAPQPEDATVTAKPVKASAPDVQIRFGN